MKFVGQLLGHHLKRYPLMQLDDVYKLLHQAALGSGHAVDDPQAARRRLEQEAAVLGTGPEEPIADVISPDGKLARIHLRAYLDAGHDLSALADAFIQTAVAYRGSRDKLSKFCACLGDLAGAGAIPFTRETVVDYFDRIARSGYPVVRHSQPYRDAYRPAYRVVALEFLPAVEPTSPS
ncbi:MAG TPA: hypothetical protein VNM24_00865 [Burkholderiales bacterium]|jgi:hypothetical protein|nr:hypothetical protein [Burkholderiales bacterium]